LFSGDSALFSRFIFVFLVLVAINPKTLLAQSCESTLHEIPLMQATLASYLAPAGVTPLFKRFFEKVLLKADLQVLHLTEQRRVDWTLAYDTGAIALQPFGPPMWGFKPTTSRPNRVPDFDRPTVITPDGNSEEDFKFFSHELAHILFADFIIKNFDKICARLPSSFAIWEEGQCKLHVDLISLLHEKYAYEMELRLLVETERTHGRRRDRTFFDLSPKDRARAVGPDATGWSEVEYWPVLQLRDLSVSEILLAGERVKTIDAAFKASDGKF
jgi:hypothetical protein